jgi:chitodextrinase
LGTLVDLAVKLRPFIEKAALSLDDEDALEAVQLFPRWDDSAKYKAGDKVRLQNVLYRCLQDHIAQPTWSPLDAPSLWAKVLIPDPEVIPEWEQPDSTNAYQIGDKVTFEGKTYECVIANNIWSPVSYPAGWKEI